MASRFENLAQELRNKHFNQNFTDFFQVFLSPNDFHIMNKTNCPGSDLQTFLNVASFNECINLCQKTYKCKALSWLVFVVKKDVHEFRARVKQRSFLKT